MNNHQNDTLINNNFNSHSSQFPHFADVAVTSQTHDCNENNNINNQKNFSPSTYAVDELTHPQSLDNHTWYRPEYFSNHSISIQVGNDYHQVFVYEDDNAKNELINHSLTNDCNFKTSPRYYMYSTLDNRRFRSIGEVCIYFALKDSNYLFYANSSVTSGQFRKEPDFSVIYKGKVYVLDVLNDGTHCSEKDAKDVRFYQEHGIAVRSYTSEECVNYAPWVVYDFLNWVHKQS